VSRLNSYICDGKFSASGFESIGGGALKLTLEDEKHW
jgi:hypothetical protein